MRILGIDPGSRATGYGLIDEKNGKLGFVSCGVIKTKSSDSLPVRLVEIYEGLCQVIATHHPGEAAVEDVFVSANPRSALKLGQARGAAIIAAVSNGLPVFEYSAKQVKLGVVGYGQAGKEQVQHVISMLLQLTTAPSTDAADALALAVCHANRRGRL
ncbi:MAG: crossover junction endodeoxyribonuclease RuvC [Deltaproteobacteria bacterium]